MNDIRRFSKMNNAIKNYCRATHIDKPIVRLAYGFYN